MNEEPKEEATKQCFCQSYYDKNGILLNCSCGKCDIKQPKEDTMTKQQLEEGYKKACVDPKEEVNHNHTEEAVQWKGRWWCPECPEIKKPQPKEEVKECECYCHKEGTFLEEEGVLSTHHKSQCPCHKPQSNKGWEEEVLAILEDYCNDVCMIGKKKRYLKRIRNLRKQDLGKIKKAIKKEYESWNSGGEFYANVSEALNRVLTYIKSLEV